jgi:hypothetical protein
MPDYDALSAQLDALVRKIDRALDDDLLNKRKQSFHLTHDDGVDDGNGNGANGGDGGDGGSYPDTWSEHADASASGNNTDYEDGEDDGDDVEDGFDKASVNRFLRENDEDNRPGALEHSDHANPEKTRHKFEALSEKLANDHGIPKSQAMAQARMDFPEVYRDYQRHRNGNMGKRAPATFEDLVNAEMAKGLNAECAAQRVVQQFGYRAFDYRALSKQEQASVICENELMKRAEDVYQNSDLNRCESLRAARQGSPRLYRALSR